MASRSKLCPFCKCSYRNLTQHLRLYHHIINNEEKQLLLKLSSGRVTGAFKCAVPDCGKENIKRLDKHCKICHKELKNCEMEMHIATSKRHYIINALRVLKASQPDPPLSEVTDRLLLTSSPLATSEQRSTQTEEQPTETENPSMESQASIYFSASDEPPPASSSFCGDPIPDVIKENDRDVTELQQTVVNLEEKFKLLEDEIRSQRRTSMIETSTGRRKFSHRVAFNPKDCPKYEAILQEFFSFTVGSNATKKRKENVMTALTHIRRFLIYAGEGLLLSGHFSFLKDHDIISRWVLKLKSDNMKPTTIKVNLVNLKKFFQFLLKVSSKLTKLSAVDFQWLQLAIRKQVTKLRADVLKHQIGVRKATLRTLVNKEDHKAFRVEARKLIPKKLTQLKKNPNTFTLHQIFGLMAGYFIAGTGHRTGVLCNMTVDEVLAAEIGDSSVVIDVSHHESAGTYGFTQLRMTSDEFAWFTTLLNLRHQLEGGTSQFFFYSSSGGQCQKILLFFQQEWRRMGFDGHFNFRHFRTTMVHHTKNISPMKKRKRIEHAMCHSEAVSNKFFVTLNNPEEAAEVVAMQRAAIGESPVISKEQERQETSERLSSKPTKRRRVYLSTSEEEDALYQHKSGLRVEEEDQEEEDAMELQRGSDLDSPCHLQPRLLESTLFKSVLRTLL
ncbi:uncharacterized protein [Hoplias malabaricus]|uniref:uncharacterized protein n=1 Tax=Hoplias malabaricus TaxID=27720 RepID=UPI003461CBA4